MNQHRLLIILNRRAFLSLMSHHSAGCRANRDPCSAMQWITLRTFIHAGQAHYQVRYILRSLTPISLAFIQKCSMWVQAHLCSHLFIQYTVHPVLYLKFSMARMGVGFISVCAELSICSSRESRVRRRGGSGRVVSGSSIQQVGQHIEVLWK